MGKHSLETTAEEQAAAEGDSDAAPSTSEDAHQASTAERGRHAASDD